MKIEHIYYRGLVKSCNYQCVYCPFCKHKSSERELVKDEAALACLIEYVERLTEPISIMITPYGEVLIHEYYQKALAYLSTLPQVRAIGCQTNASFAVDKFSELLGQYRGERTKLRLWCSYHPSMVSEEDFLYTCCSLRDAAIPYCVGSVAIASDIDVLKNMRKRLPAQIYFWLNKLDGLRNRYSKEEIEAFLSIDPLFSMQLKEWIAESSCGGGTKSIFVEADGTFFACNISKAAIGNIYRNDINERLCLSKRCSCYLAYVNQLGNDVQDWFGKEKYFRMVDRGQIKAFFLDLDGTLLNRNGLIDEEIIEVVQTLAQTKDIYLVTSRSYKSAMLKCRKIQSVLAGGVFANGAYCYIGKNISQIWLKPINNAIIQLVNKKPTLKMVCCCHNQVLYRITVIGKRQSLDELRKMIEQAYQGQCAFLLEGNMLSITSEGINKGSGIREILSYIGLDKSKVAAVGNAINDISMIQEVGELIAVPNAHKEMKRVAKHILPIQALPWIY